MHIPKTLKFPYLSTLILTWLFLPSYLAAQPVEYLFPPVKSWKGRDLGFPSQAWVLTSGANGTIHAGIPGGILSFTGNRWLYTSIPDGRTVRSLVSSSDDHIYWGTSNNYGFLIPDPDNGRPFFESLISRLPEGERNLGTIWSMAAGENEMLLKIGRIIHIVRPDTTIILKLERTVDTFYRQGEEYLGSADGLGFFSIRDTTVRFFDQTVTISKDYIQYLETVGSDSILFIGRNTGIGTISLKDGGIILWPDGNHDFLKKAHLYGAERLPDGGLLVNTLGAGIFEFTSSGHLTHRYGKYSGLPTDNVKDILVTENGDIWAGTESGIAFIERSSPFRYLDERSGLEHLPLTIKKFNGEILIGTGNGLYRINQKTGKVELGTSFEYQVFDMLDFHGHPIGATGGKIVDLKTGKEFTRGDRSRFISRSKSNPKIVYTGSIRGVFFYIDAKEKLLPSHYIRKFVFDTENIVEYNGKLWIDTFTNGVFSFPFTGSVADTIHRAKRVGSGPEFESGPHSLLADKNRLFMFNLHGAWEIINDSTLNPVNLSVPPGWQIASEPESDGNGRWFILMTDNQKRIRFLIGNPFTGWTYTLPEGLATRRFDFTWMENDSTWWAGGVDGLVRFNPDRLPQQKPIGRTGIALVILNNADTLWNGLWSDFKPLELGILKNPQQLTIIPIIPGMSAEGHRTVRYRLEPEMSDWQPYEQLSAIRVSGFDPGKQMLTIQARSAEGVEHIPVVLSFSIPAPWYSTWWMWLFYILTGIGLIIITIRWRTESLKRKQRVLETVIAKNSAEMAMKQKLAAIGQLSAGLAHELNNALAVINTNSELAQSLINSFESANRSALSPDDRNDLRLSMNGLQTGSDRIESIVRSMQRASNPHQSQSLPTQINEVIQTVIDFTRPLYPVFSVNLKPSADIPIVLINPAALNLAIYNLLVNAIEATEHAMREDKTGNYHPSVVITTSYHTDSKKITIQIEDNGKGIPQELLLKIFDPFFTTKPVGKGKGMGLNEAFQFIKSLHGELTINNREGGTGVQVTISLPTQNANGLSPALFS